MPPKTYDAFMDAIRQRQNALSKLNGHQNFAAYQNSPEYKRCDTESIYAVLLSDQIPPVQYTEVCSSIVAFKYEYLQAVYKAFIKSVTLAS